MKRLLFTFFILFFLISCEEEVTPEYLIAEDTYIDLMVEFQIIKSYSYLDTDLKIDSARIVILSKYGVSRENFLKSHMYYQQDGLAQMERIDKALELLKTVEDEMVRSEQDSTAQD